MLVVVSGALALGTEPAIAGVSFGEPTSYPTGSQPRSVGTGDFDRDGKLDLAVANAVSRTVSVMVGRGDGSFGAATDYPTPPPGYLSSIAVGDFNADDDPDLVVANWQSRSVSILLGGPGAAFSPPAFYATGASPQDVAVGDFNADGDPDLAVANYLSDTVSVLLGGDGGSFGPRADYGTGARPISVAAGDFNADGDPDLVATNEFGAAISVLLGGSGGSFGPPSNYSTPGGPVAVAVGAFDTDADLDLAVAHWHIGTISLLVGGDGGSFSVRATYPTGSNPISVAVGDFNADRDPDLAVANRGSDDVSVLLNTTRPAAPIPTSTSPASPANDDSPRVKGTAAAGTTVRLYTSADCSGEPVAAGSAEDFGGAGIATRVDDDTTTTFRARTVDSAGDPSHCSEAAVTYVEDSTAPPRPAELASAPASPANDNAPKIRGAAEAGSTVRHYTSSDCSGEPVASGAAAAFADPGLEVAVDDDTTTTFRARATDRAGNPSPCSEAALTYVEDSTAPRPTLAAPPATTDDTTPTLAGTAGTASGDAAEVTVRIYAGADVSAQRVQSRTAVRAADGSYSVEASPALSPGTYTAQTEQGDHAGNAGRSEPRTFAITRSAEPRAEPEPSRPTFSTTDSSVHTDGAGRFGFRVGGCLDPAGCSGRATFATAHRSFGARVSTRPRRLARVTFALPAGRTVTLRVRLNPRGRRLLRRERRLRVRATVELRDRAGNVRSGSHTFTLVDPRVRRRPRFTG